MSEDRLLLVNRYFDRERSCGVDPMEAIAYAIASRSAQLARDRDAYARRLLEDRLPRPLHFLIDRPKALKRVLRVVKRWEPTFVFVHLDSTTTAESAVEMSERWLAEMRAKGVWHPPSNAAFVFTYTDQSGLPAEVYGVNGA